MQEFTVLTLFPEMFPGPLDCSLVGKAKGTLWDINIENIRDYTEDKRKTVDDRIYGGGAGMVLKPDVIGTAIEKCVEKYKPQRLIYFSPRGKLLDASVIQDLKASSSILLLCGRYEGVDQRVIDYYNLEEISLGNFVISGGEIAAYALIDACVRLIPGVINNKEATLEESFGEDTEYSELLEYHVYTRPAEWKGLKVPEVLLSGDHQKVNKWRKNEAIAITKSRRQVKNKED